VCYELTSLDSGRTYAGKIIPRATLAHKPSAQKKMVHEIKIHRSIAHQNVVKFERFFEDHQNVYLLLELCSNHSLMELVRRRQRLTEPEVQYFMWSLVNTMAHLHGRHIIHRDLKLGNLFLNADMELRIGDFGLATQLDHAEERKQTLCGTPNYIAPEILSKGGHSFEVDTWAMGQSNRLIFGRRSRNWVPLLLSSHSLLVFSRALLCPCSSCACRRDHVHDAVRSSSI
jgi:polo-like kinase 1